MINPWDWQDSSFSVIPCKDRLDWLKHRRNYIGASDAAAVLGLSPWMSNTQLFDEKTSKEPPVESEPNADVLRGIRSEGHIRELYAIESGDEVIDGAGMLLVSNEYQWMSATLDGICRNSKGENYILEIKSSRYNGKWSDGSRLPDNYFVQVLHQLAVTKWPKAVLKARLLCANGNVIERTYTMERKDFIVQIENLAMVEKKFWDAVKSGVRPNTMLPEL